MAFAPPEQDLYVDLFSNSSLALYPKNRVSSFTVNLDHPIQLSGEYECALAQLICPSTTSSSLSVEGQIVISTFPETTLQRTGRTQKQTSPFNDVNVDRSSYRPKPTTQLTSVSTYSPKAAFVAKLMYSFVYNITGEEENFANGEQLVNFINRLLTTNRAKKENPAFAAVISQRKYTQEQVAMEINQYPATFLMMDHVLQVHIRDVDFSVAISGGLARSLGFGVSDDQWVIFDQVGTYQFNNQKLDLNAGKPTILSIYTNIILPHRVADTSASLIRVCTLPTKSTDGTSGFITFDFDTLHYLPVVMKHIQEIQVEVRGNAGELIPFEAGILYVRLHFRPRRQR